MVRHAVLQEWYRQLQIRFGARRQGRRACHGQHRINCNGGRVVLLPGGGRTICALQTHRMCVGEAQQKEGPGYARAKVHFDRGAVDNLHH
jgi:hypothetical protein